MDYKKMKSTVSEIKLSDEKKSEIINKCKTLATGESNMKKNTSTIKFRKPLTVAATVAVCLCLTVGAIAGFSGGFFRDIIRPDGAVTGTEYLRLAEELTVTTDYENGKLTANIAAADAAAIPYRELEELAIKEYSILDSDNKTICTGAETEYYDFTDGKVEIPLNIYSMNDGNYTLIITRFSGSGKADSPLTIKGEWKCEFNI